MPGILWKMRNLPIHAKTTQAQSSNSGDSSHDSLTYGEEQFEVMFVTEEELPHRESMGGDFFQGGVALILSLCEGGGGKLFFAS